MSEALSGVRVLEVCDRSAALTGRILADLGAEVIMVEPPGGAALRHEAPFYGDQPGLDHSFGHLYLNANKRSVVLDLRDPRDRLRFLAELVNVDVVLESMPPGCMDGWGLSHAQMRAVKPDLIQCSVTPFGQTTPWRDRLANDLVAGAAGGLIFVSGSPQGTPTQGGANPSYTMSGLAAVSAISIALHQRDFTQHTGLGVHIDLSVQEATALAVMQTNCPVHWQWFKRVPRRPGLSAAMPCKDGKFVSLLVRPERFEAFIEWADRVGIDHQMTPDDWRWARLDAPRKNNPVTATTLALAAALTRDQFVAGALQAEVVCLPVLDFPDLEQAEQFKVNQEFLQVQHEYLDAPLAFVRSPVNAMDDGVDIRRAPSLGEHQGLLQDWSASEFETAPAPAAVKYAKPEVALSGLRVVDFGWVLAAPIGTRLLASFGAEVIRVESSQKPDSMRGQVGPDGTPDVDLGGLFNSVNAGKKSFTVDLTTDRGLAVVKRLIATADVVVNNFRPGALEKMGLGYEVLKGLKPDIVLLNLPGAHRNGPWAQRPSMGNILMAASGFNMLTGFPGERPRGVGIAYPDFTSPHLLVTTVLAALRHRERFRVGQEIHLTQLSGMLSLLGCEWMEYKARGEQPARNANRNPNFAPHGVYPALSEQDPESDAWVALAVGSESQWHSLCEVIGVPEWCHDPRFANHESRKRHEDQLDALIADWTQNHDKWWVADQLQSVGVAAAPVEHLKDMLERDPQLPNHYQQVHQPVAPEVDIPIDKEAARWVGSELLLRRAPTLGEHNQYVLQDILGIGDEEFVALLADDIVS